MIAYDDLVNALAAWRSRQGLAETGADYLGPETPFPEYRVARPASTDRSVDSYESAEAGGYAEPYESADASDYESDYAEAEAVAAYAEVHDVVEDDIEAAEAEVYAEADELEADEVEHAPADEYAISYDDRTDANSDVAALASAGDEADVYEMEADAPSTVIAATPESEAAYDDAEDEGATQLGEAGEPLFANDETTSIGTGIDAIAPAVPTDTFNESLDDELAHIEIDSTDSVSYGDDDDDDDSKV